MDDGEEAALADLLDRLNAKRNRMVWPEPGRTLADALTMILDRLENVEASDEP